MEKYFMTGTDDEVKFGDEIELDMVDTKSNKVVHKKMQCKFVPDMVELLAQQGIIEAREVEEPKANDKKVMVDMEAFLDNLCDVLNKMANHLTAIHKTNQALMRKVASLESKIANIKAVIPAPCNGKKVA